MHRRATLGALGEDIAAEHYQRLDFVLIARNARTRGGEIDLIVWKDGLLVFIEVRTRVQGPVGPLESIDRRKARQVRRMAAVWLSVNSPPRGTRDIRLDAVGVTVTRNGKLESLECLEGVL